MLILARRPELLDPFIDLAAAGFSCTDLPHGLFDLIGQVASSMGDCAYSQKHRADAAARRGVARQKFDAIPEFETSSLFSDAERAALRLARDAFTVPSAVTDANFVELRKFYSEAEIVDLVARLCHSAYMTIWNNTMGTQLEK
jgi:alkylhydroperoxidase family enzyme